MARCNNCNKFVSIEEQDPEVNGLEVDDDGNVTAEVRIVNACADCGDELTETTFNMEGKVDLDHNSQPGKEHELSAEEDGDSERTTRTEGKGRGLRTFYGAALECEVTCTCGATSTLRLSDDIQASRMDSLS